VIILEGWCVGARPISNQYLYKNINNLETFQDPYFKWRNNYNNYLSSYQKIFSKFNFFIYLQFNDWKSIIEWKYKQELRLRNKKKDLSLKKYLSEFIQYYEKISRWMYIKSPHDCQLLIKINKDQKIKQIKWPQKVT
jgi:D-glycerate 3-kinase